MTARSRGTRVLRALSAASVATFVALLSHIAAGGAMPGVVGIVVPLTIASLVCVALIGRTLSLPRLTLAVAVSQTLFHVLFVLGAGNPVMGGAPAHHGHGAGALSFEPSDIVQGDVGMWAAHLFATIATIAVLHRGESAIRALARLSTEFCAALRRSILALVPVALPERRRGSLLGDVVRVVRVRGIDVSSATRRGPPVLTAV